MAIVQIYQHYQNKHFYRILNDNGFNTETKGREVYYKNIVDGQEYNRPYDIFFGKIAEEIDRFTLVIEYEIPHSMDCHCQACMEVKNAPKIGVLRYLNTDEVTAYNYINKRKIPAFQGKYEDVKEMCLQIADVFEHVAISAIKVEKEKW